MYGKEKSEYYQLFDVKNPGKGIGRILQKFKEKIRGVNKMRKMKRILSGVLGLLICILGVSENAYAATGEKIYLCGVKNVIEREN